MIKAVVFAMGLITTALTYVAWTHASVVAGVLAFLLSLVAVHLACFDLEKTRDKSSFGHKCDSCDIR